MNVRQGYLSEQTRNDAFATLKVSESQRRVLEYIRKNHPCSNEQISHGLGIPSFRITGRVTELRDFGMIVHAGYAYSSYKKRVSLWAPKPEEFQLSLF